MEQIEGRQPKIGQEPGLTGMGSRKCVPPCPPPPPPPRYRLLETNLAVGVFLTLEAQIAKSI